MKKIFAVVQIVIVVSMLLALLKPVRLSAADSGNPRCSESEVLSKQNICEPIIVSTERKLHCPKGYSLEASSEKRAGAVQIGHNNFFRCIPRRPGMPAYVVTED